MNLYVRKIYSKMGLYVGKAIGKVCYFPVDLSLPLSFSESLSHGGERPLSRSLSIAPNSRQSCPAFAAPRLEGAQTGEQVSLPYLELF